VELKQVGFGSAHLTEGRAEGALRELRTQLKKYHHLLAGMGGVKHDVFGLLFVNGNLSFGSDGPNASDRTDWWDNGLHFHVRLVNLPLSAKHEERQMSLAPSLLHGPRKRTGKLGGRTR
jgi:hypothetical protein